MSTWEWTSCVSLVLSFVDPIAFNTPVFFPVLITSPMRSFTMMGKLSPLLVTAGVGAHSFEAHQQQ